MQLTTTVRLLPDAPDALLAFMRQFNAACDWAAGVAFEQRLFHWHPLQARAYRELRERFGLTATGATVAVRKAAYAYRVKARRGAKARVRPFGAIPLFRHVYFDDGTVRFYGMRMRFVSRPGVTLPRHPTQATLSYRRGKFVVQQSVEALALAPKEATSFLGCDLGIVNILMDSDGETYSGAQVNGLRHRHARLRAKLQAKGTKSARRLLVRRRMKEAWFARAVNHRISKRVVAKARTASRGVASGVCGDARGRARARARVERSFHGSQSSPGVAVLLDGGRMGAVPVVSWQVLHGYVLDVLRAMPAASPSGLRVVPDVG